ncbi:MAG: flavin reductase family protein [Sulfolobales archaeon]
MEELDPFEVLDLVPHPLAIVTAGDPDTPGKRGGMTAAWVTRVSWDPPLIAVAMTKERYTYSLIKEFKAFAVHVVSKKFEKVALEIFGSMSGKNLDKFEKARIEPARADKVVAPIIPGMPAIMECKLVLEYEAGDHVIVVGEVVKGYRGAKDPPVVWISSSIAEVRVITS